MDKNTAVSRSAMLAELGDLRDDYERQRVLLCERDPKNVMLMQLTLKHLKARRLNGHSGQS